MTEYNTILKWCRIFLMNKSFTAFKGSEVAFALLFPMEQLFESYVAERIRHYMDPQKYRVFIQDHRHHLFDRPRKFLLQPDIVVINQLTDEKVILDTKWKRLSSQYPNYGISQSDIYQMYVYHKKYHPKKVYPFNQSFASSEQVLSYHADEDLHVEISASFFDLLHVKESLKQIEQLMQI